MTESRAPRVTLGEVFEALEELSSGHATFELTPTRATVRVMWGRRVSAIKSAGATRERNALQPAEHLELPATVADETPRAPIANDVPQFIREAFDDRI